MLDLPARCIRRLAAAAVLTLSLGTNAAWALEEAFLEATCDDFLLFVYSPNASMTTHTVDYTLTLTPVGGGNPLQASGSFDVTVQDSNGLEAEVFAQWSEWFAGGLPSGDYEVTGSVSSATLDPGQLDIDEGIAMLLQCTSGGVPVCGDSMVEGNEECDDGNLLDGDGCRSDCTQELCGDGVDDPQEQCDDGNNNGGDGCRADCTLEICGDGIFDAGEGCDDGNTVDGDGCRANCTQEICGDAILDAGEECDDGNDVAGDGCSVSCQVEVCGNGVLDPGEACDDGNLADGDGCRNNCSIEVCGDGFLDPNEQCDDGNNVDGDGCTAACQVELLGGEGCTPGYWKQAHHFDSWTAPYTPDTPFADVFEDVFPGRTLLDVVSRNGGGLNALGRHTVAALLNAASAGVSYDEALADVIGQFNHVPPGTKSAYNQLKNSFEAYNEQGCPLN